MHHLLDCTHPLIKCKREDILHDPVSIVVNNFNENSAEDFRKNMVKAHNTGQNIVPVFIDSFGGSVYSLLSMIDTIQAATLPVATVVTGKAMSCGAVLSAFGTVGHRYISPHASLMIHEVSSASIGKASEMKEDVKQTLYLNRKIMHMLAKQCSQPKDYFIKMVHNKSHADCFLVAAEAKKHNLVDHVKVPSWKSEISVRTTFA